MYRDRDFDAQQGLPSNHEALMQDLELATLFNGMASGDQFLFDVAKAAVLSGLQADVETVLYRQDVLKDCLRNESTVRAMYDISVEGLECRKKVWGWNVANHYASSILSGARELLQLLMDVLGKLRLISDQHRRDFESEGFKTLVAMLTTELSDEYFATVKGQLEELKFRRGVLVSAGLGTGNEGTNHVLRKPQGGKPGLIQQLFSLWRSDYTIRIDPKDEAGGRTVQGLRDRGINLVANALAQSAEHILSFFHMLRTELAFYIGGINLHRRLAQKGVPACFPTPAPAHVHRHSCADLRDVCLALTIEQVVGNDMDADGKDLVVITGANQGGKSTFLRTVGLAQLMMQCGMFVTAESFSAAMRRGLFTHYKREEDVTMKSGKLDEELRRMSAIVDALTPDSMVLFNESFAATNEREGSEIARQVVLALVERGARVFFVTHMSEFARSLWLDRMDNALFLRAERQADGRRTFKLLPGEPLQTSFGVDLYQEVFGDASTSV